MKLYKKLFGAIAGCALAIAPVSATVDEGSPSLIKTLDASGINISFNSPEHCSSDEYLGVYIHRGMQRALALCPGATVDPIDHAVVRHEAWHAIQHCVSVVRGTPLNTPIQENTSALMAEVYEYLDESYIRVVQENYDRSQWLLELEANVAMVALTAAEIEEIFLMACTADF